MRLIAAIAGSYVIFALKLMTCLDEIMIKKNQKAIFLPYSDPKRSARGAFVSMDKNK
jgi:hypothetical protein